MVRFFILPPAAILMHSGIPFWQNAVRTDIRRLFFFLFLAAAIISTSAEESGFLGIPNAAEGHYIGSNLFSVSERVLLEKLIDGIPDDPATAKLISGHFSSNSQYNSQISRTHATGYTLELTDRSSGKAHSFSWNLGDLISQVDMSEYHREKRSVPAADFRDHAIWYYLDLRVSESCGGQYLVELDRTLFSWFDVFVLEEGQYVRHAGSFETSLNERGIPSDRITIPINLPSGPTRIYFRADAVGKTRLPVRFWTPERYLKHRTANFFFHGGVVFVGLTLALYAIYLFFSLSERGYLYMAFVVVTTLAVHLGMSGIGFTILWPGRPDVGVMVIYLFLPLTITSNLLFARSFLKLRHSIWNEVLIGIMVLSLLIIPAQLVFQGSGPAIFGATVVLDYLTVIPLIAAVILRIRSGMSAARYFLVALIFQIASYLEYWLTTANILPYNYLEFIQLRSIGFALLMMMGMSSRLRTLNANLQQLRSEMDGLVQNKLVGPNGKTITETTVAKVEAVKDYISANYHRTLTRNDLADSVGISPDHLGRMFLKLTGERISDMIQRMRIETACEVLAGSERRIIDAAFDVGFESLRTFNAAFAARMDCSPSEYRRRMNLKEEGHPDVGVT